MQNIFFGEGFSTTEFFADKERSAKESRAMFFACGRYGYIYIYMCIHIYIYSFTRHVHCTIAIRLQVKGGNFQPNRFPRETNNCCGRNLCI